MDFSAILPYIVPGSVVLSLVAWLTKNAWTATAALVRIEKMEAEVAAIQDTLSTLRVSLARDYVTYAVLKDMEDRIMRQFDRLYEAIRRPT